MSTRGAKFLEQWVSDHIMDHTADGLLSANELAARAIADALKEGIPAEEIEDETGSVFEVILEALLHRGGDLPGEPS